MPHLLVSRLRVIPGGFLRGLGGSTAEEAARRVEAMNPLAWREEYLHDLADRHVGGLGFRAHPFGEQTLQDHGEADEREGDRPIQPGADGGERDPPTAGPRTFGRRSWMLCSVFLRGFFCKTGLPFTPV